MCGPTYLDMIATALCESKKARSRQYLANYIIQNYDKKEGARFNAALRNALQRGIDRNILKITKTEGTPLYTLVVHPNVNSKSSNVTKKSKSKSKNKSKSKSNSKSKNKNKSKSYIINPKSSAITTTAMINENVKKRQYKYV